MTVSELPDVVARNIHFSTSERMNQVEDETVQSVICSPPYWNLKDYEHPEQIGHGETYDRYHERMDQVWSECRRVLKRSGTMWIVVDKMWHQGEVLHLPFHIAQRCQKLGFHLQDMIIWNKPTAIAGMNARNLVNKYEFVVFLSKNSSHFKFNPLREGEGMPPDYTQDGDMLTDVWRFPVKAGSIKKTPDHKAPYPEELIERIVMISTDNGDTVLDPYLGSGTTMGVALAHGRQCIGYEINRDFEALIVERLRTLPPGVQKEVTSFE